MKFLQATATKIYIQLDYCFNGCDYDFEQTIDIVDDADLLAQILVNVMYNYSIKVAAINEDLKSYMKEVIVPNVEWFTMVDNEYFVKECKEYFEDDARIMFEEMMEDR